MYGSTKWLIAFDVDGTLLERPRSSWKLIHELLGTLDKAKRYPIMYMRGEISYDEWAKLEASLWRGIEYEWLKERVIREIKLRDGCKELFQEIRKRNSDCIFISAGLGIIVYEVAKMLGVNEVYTNELVVDKNGRITGDVIVRVSFKGKEDILRRIAIQRGIPKSRIIAIGDSESDIGMFRAAGTSIVVNPENERVVRYADYVVHSNSLRPLISILRSIMQE